MPQASTELQDEFPDGDAEALIYLEGFGIKPDRGGMFTVQNRDDYPRRVWMALQYLRDEWDYGIALIEPAALQEPRT